MGSAADGRDSAAEALFDERHWPELRVVVVVASANEKETPSTEGMARSVATSPFLGHRAAAIAPRPIAELQTALADRDFAAFAALSMRDPNSFHATRAGRRPRPSAGGTVGRRDLGLGPATARAR